MRYPAGISNPTYAFKVMLVSMFSALRRGAPSVFCVFLTWCCVAALPAVTWAQGSSSTVSAPPAPAPLQLPPLAPVTAAEPPASAPAGLFTPTAAADVPRAWRADLTAGATVVTGNTESVATSMRAEAVRQTLRHRLQLEAQYLGTRTPEAGTNRMASGVARQQVDLRHSSFYFAQGDALHDEAQNLSGRYGISAGLGRHVIESDTSTWDVSLGFGYTADEYSKTVLIDDDSVRSYTRQMAVLTEESRHKWGATTTLRQRINVLRSLKDNATRTELDTHLDVAMNSVLSLSVGLTYRHDSKPTNDLKKADTTLVTGLKARLY